MPQARISSPMWWILRSAVQFLYSAIADEVGIVVLPGGLIRNHTTALLFPERGCMAFSSSNELRRPGSFP